MLIWFIDKIFLNRFLKKIVTLTFEDKDTETDKFYRDSHAHIKIEYRSNIFFKKLFISKNLVGKETKILLLPTI